MRLSDLIPWKGHPRRRLTADGVVVVRRFLSAEWTRQVKSSVNDIYTEMAACSDFPDPDMAAQYRDWVAVWMKPLPDFLAARNSTLHRRYEEAVAHVIGVTQAIFGSEWLPLSTHSFFRRVIGLSRPQFWHIDADAASIGRERSINVWLPLDDVGTSLPSLDIVPTSHRKVRQTPFWYEPAKRHDFVATIGPTWTPILKAGDALVFDQYTLHRTQLVGSEESMRTSCEFRFWAP